MGGASEMSIALKIMPIVPLASEIKDIVKCWQNSNERKWTNISCGNHTFIIQVCRQISAGSLCLKIFSPQFDLTLISKQIKKLGSLLASANNHSAFAKNRAIVN
jgi:hypothetical protein